MLAASPSSAADPDVPPVKTPEELEVLLVEPSLAQPAEDAPPLTPRPFSASASHSASDSDSLDVEVLLAALAVLEAVEDARRLEEIGTVEVARVVATAETEEAVVALALRLTVDDAGP